MRAMLVEKTRDDASLVRLALTENGHSVVKVIVDPKLGAPRMPRALGLLPDVQQELDALPAQPEIAYIAYPEALCGPRATDYLKLCAKRAVPAFALETQSMVNWIRARARERTGAMYR